MTAVTQTGHGYRLIFPYGSSSIDFTHLIDDGNTTGVRRVVTFKKKFWEEVIAYYPLIHGSHRKQFLVIAGKCLPSRCLATVWGYAGRLIWTFLWYDTDRLENMLATILLLRVFVAAVTCLPTRYLASKGGIHILLSLCLASIGGTHI
jgi:hypothetical protein